MTHLAATSLYIESKRGLKGWGPVKIGCAISATLKSSSKSRTWLLSPMTHVEAYFVMPTIVAKVSSSKSTDFPTFELPSHKLTRMFQSFWESFIITLDPNSGAGTFPSPQIKWPLLWTNKPGSAH